MKQLIAIVLSLLALLGAVQAAAAADQTPDAVVNATNEAIRHALAARPSPTPASTLVPETYPEKNGQRRLEKFEASAHSDLAIGVGSVSELPVASAASIRISNSAVLSAEDLGAHLRLIGRKPGEALVQAGAKTWRVSVLSAVDWASYQNLIARLKNARGLRVRVRDGVARVEGHLLRSSDWRDLAAIEDVNYRFSAVVDDTLAETLRPDVLKNLAAAQLPVPSFRLSPEAKVFLSSEQAGLLPAYEKALQPWGFAVEINSTLVTLAPLVRIKILVAEVDRNFAQKLGVNWQQALQAQILPTWVGVKQASTLTLSLDALESSGVSRVLASPNILCRSGKEAQFLAGGEFPIKITNFAAQDVTWKQYGVLLKVSPVADAVGHMSIAIKTEVSDIDGTRTVEGIPAMTTNRIESHFDLAHSQTIALSGLIKKKSSDSRDGLPFLSQLPILGQLFSSRAFNHDESELMIFVTPEVVHPEEGSSI